jgi:signal peptidase I
MRLFRSSQLSLRKSKGVLRHVYHLYRRKKKKLSPAQNEQIKSTLSSLQQEILNKDRGKAHELSQQALELSKLHLKKTGLDNFRDLLFALIFALIVAVLVRQMWFEFYEIPTGSMRPTLKEQDRLVVSKTNFGINLPLTVKHLYFDPNLVQRSGIFIFTGENMDIRDVDTLYFYIFPGKKQFIKRMIGKPGDTLYFYGGQIYGIDDKGQDISSQFQLPELNLIDHIPFIRFEGNISIPHSSMQGVYSPIVIYQMNEPVARLYVTAQNQINGEMLNLSQIRNPLAAAPLKEYGDLWGFKNYAMARLLTKDQAKQQSEQMISDLEDGILYLELRHHPSFSSAKLSRDEMGRVRPSLGYSTSIIPLQEKHLKDIFSHMYTARFIVKNGFARRYGMDQAQASANPFLPHFNDVPDGCYEFYYGKAYQVKWQGITIELPPSHPLCKFDPQRVQMLFNLGIEFDTRFSPQTRNQKPVPARYAYFRDHDLYLLGTPILTSGDQTLAHFVDREHQKQAASIGGNHYLAFEDLGPPHLPNGKLDIGFIREYGLMVPQNMYLALGDNYAMSSDSRDFGFVPQENIRGGPDFIFWPPGKRWGLPNQPSYPVFNLPRTIIWILVLGCIIIWWIVYNKRNKLPLKDLN